MLRADFHCNLSCAFLSSSLSRALPALSMQYTRRLAYVGRKLDGKCMDISCAIAILSEVVNELRQQDSMGNLISSVSCALFPGCRIVEVPVDRVVEKVVKVEVPTIQYVEKVIVQTVEKIVEKVVEVPVPPGDSIPRADLAKALAEVAKQTADQTSQKFYTQMEELMNEISDLKRKLLVVDAPREVNQTMKVPRRFQLGDRVFVEGNAKGKRHGFVVHVLDQGPPDGQDWVYSLRINGQICDGHYSWDEMDLR